MECVEAIIEAESSNHRTRMLKYTALFAIVSVWTLLAVAAPLMLYRRRHWYLRNRSCELSIIMCIMTNACCTFIIVGRLFDDQNCFINLAGVGLTFAATFAVIALRMIIFYIKFGFNDCVALNEEETEWKYSHNRFWNSLVTQAMKKRKALAFVLFQFSLLLFLPTLIYLLVNIETIHLTTGDEGCSFFYMIITCCPSTILLQSYGMFFAFSVRGELDNLKLRREVILLGAAGSVAVIILTIWAFISGDVLAPLTFCCWSYPQACIVISILYPALKAKRTRENASLSSPDSSKDAVSQRFYEILWILNDPSRSRSFQYFLAAEFSAENAFFYKDVQQFRKDPSKWHALRMYKRYVDIDSPMCINVSHSARECARLRIEKDNISLDMFDELEVEVLRLLTHDSLRRFKSTPVYEAMVTTVEIQ